MGGSTLLHSAHICTARCTRPCFRLCLILCCRLAEHYRLLDIPVDVLAGGRDGVIPPAAVLHHVRVSAGKIAAWLGCW